MSQTETRGVSVREPRPWGRALCWLVFLAPFFYLTYGARERHRGRVDTTFRPSCSRGNATFRFSPGPSFRTGRSTSFYGFSVFVCRTRDELDAHGRRLLTAQIVATSCFILFPLKFTFPQPGTHGLAGVLFAALTSFDKPFNQAPSLHIALLVILWRLYAIHLPRPARWPLHIWFALVGASVLTTYQHHFFDVPTGALLGFLCLWLWPERDSSPVGEESALDRSQASRPGDPLPARRRFDRRARVVDRRRRIMVAVAGHITGDRRRELRRCWARRIPERRSGTYEPGGASSARAVSSRRLRQFTVVDSTRTKAGRNRRRRLALAHPLST